MSTVERVFPQVAATLVASSFAICYGALLVYPAVLIGQLKKINNLTDDDDFVSINDNDASWISSIGSPALVVITIILTFIVDRFGRLNSMRLMVPVVIVGQIMVATSSSLSMLLAGRVISFGASGCFPIVASVYIAEISSPGLRGTLLSYKATCISLGILLTYIKGKYLHWRIVAYVVSGYAATILVLSMFIPESALWLASKNKLDQAKKSSQWFGTPEPVVVSPQKRQHDWNAFRKPTFYKPMLIGAGFYLFQEFTGGNVIFITLVTFFNDFGTEFDPFTVSICIGLVKLLVNLTNAWTMVKFGRRSLSMFSLFGMAVAIIISATFTMWINNSDDSTSFQWVPPAMLTLYVIFHTTAIMFMPHLMSSEMCPGSIRGTAQSISYFISYVWMFVALQLYYLMKQHYESWYIQYYFGVLSIGGLLFVYVFLPETHKKTLTEIEDYFWSHSNYISAEAAKKNKIGKNGLLNESNI